MRITKMIRGFFRRESAATAIEYALIACSVAGVIYAGVYLFGDATKALFVSVSQKVIQRIGQ